MLMLIIGLLAGCAEQESPVPPKSPAAKPTAQTPVDTANAPAATGNGKPTPKPTTPAAPTKPAKPAPSKPAVVAENKAFRVFAPAENSVVGKTFTVKGEARVFEAAFSYSFEDGHNVLAEGHVMADQGAPAWGKFAFDVTIKEASSPVGILTLYESSAKDGSKINVLHIAVKFADGIVKPVREGE
ncbi:Gmad2 immunoglobulin-like domain-containing protein [Paenibacillus curdlanolyticus]|nr:Gmad2 immunoglobulin-like domain-containing protein [Paenibacillus curdlanolyticus]